MQPTFEILHMPPKSTNSVLLTLGSDAVIFDAWGRAEDWENMLAQRKLNLRAIYATHGHGDHISAAPALAEKFNIPWYLNARDEEMVPEMNGLLNHYGLQPISKNYRRPANLSAGEIEILPGIRASVIETPGHSKGGVAFYFESAAVADFIVPGSGFGRSAPETVPLQSAPVLIIGDTLFQEEIGAYHFHGGNLRDLRASISKIYDMNLPDDTVVIHGHGMETTIAWLKENNKYFR